MEENRPVLSEPMEILEEGGGFWGAFARKQTYLNISYLILSFPLSIAYFVFITTGFALGFGLAIIGIGLLILPLMVVAMRGLAAWERQLGIWLLGSHIPEPEPNPPIWQHPWITLKRYVADSYTWKALLYFILKFPMAIISFIAVVFFCSFSLSLILTPFMYRIVPIRFFEWRIVRAEEAFLCVALGLAIGWVSVHVLNGLAALHRMLATAMLSGTHKAHSQLKSGPVVIP
jgi:hypothetical protein